MKKHILITLAVLAVGALAACEFFPMSDASATAVAGTLQSMSQIQTAVAATVAASIPQQQITLEPTQEQLENPPDALHLETQCGHFSIFINPAIADGSFCQNVAENINPDGMLFDTYPAHDELTLTGYVTGEKFHTPRIIVYPISRYAELVPDRISSGVETLQSQLSGTPIQYGIPLLPIFNAAQVFHAKVQRIDSAGFSGMRFITTYSQWTVPINNNELFYTFQGITSDGQYWISVILPVTNAFLPETDEVAGGDFVAWSNGYEAYLASLVPQLDALADDSFNPPLASLDAMIRTIVITP